MISVSNGNITLSGRWTINELPEITASEVITKGLYGQIIIDAGAITEMDSSGALALSNILKKAANYRIDNIDKNHKALLDTVMAAAIPPLPVRRKKTASDMTEYVGKRMYRFLHHLASMLAFIGEIMEVFLQALKHPKHLRFGQVARHVHEVGVQAIPIVALMAFLISIVLAYQGSAQLRPFGAEIFTINLVAISILREMGVLLTAIMVAGRSGSAFAAEIGTMKINEEVDALKTIGMDPVEVLVLPRVIAMVIALPLLTFIANISGLAAAAVTCNMLLDIPFPQFADRIASLKLWHFWIGLLKAPVFAFLIAVIGCERGIKVHSSAEMIGLHTTLAVVRSIFVVLLADALFSILFTTLKI